MKMIRLRFHGDRVFSSTAAVRDSGGLRRCSARSADDAHHLAIFPRGHHAVGDDEGLHVYHTATGRRVASFFGQHHAVEDDAGNLRVFRGWTVDVGQPPLTPADLNKQNAETWRERRGKGWLA